MALEGVGDGGAVKAARGVVTRIREQREGLCCRCERRPTRRRQPRPSGRAREELMELLDPSMITEPLPSGDWARVGRVEISLGAEACPRCEPSLAAPSVKERCRQSGPAPASRALPHICVGRRTSSLDRRSVCH